MSAQRQRRLILHMSVSLDGFVTGADGKLDWLAPNDAVDHGDQRHRLNREMLSQLDVILLGRVAYEEMGPAWASSDSPMAQLMNALPKVVFSESESLTELGWSNARRNELPLAEEIEQLKREPGRDIVAFGGGHFAHSLIRERLVDEYRLTVHPVALGSGISLMHGLPEPQRFELVSSTTYTDGCVMQVLRPDRGEAR